ncbi:MAG TPA: hypothetical protein PKW15_07300 [Alphaproteobacteria bacterium]|nr:hypothetical protein [Alphaproteobacteria bacterium]
MSASQIGAYQAASFVFNERAHGGNEVARANAAQEAPAFKASLNGLQTRAGADESANTNSAKKRGSGGGAQSAGRGRFVDILA